MRINEVCADPEIERIDIVVAWAKRSGFRLIENALKDFRERGGEIRIITGISQHGATLQGLQNCLELANESYVFNVDRRTFHPKLYRFEGPARNEVIIGSSNLTAGGVVTNFEASTRISAARDDSRLLPPIFDQIDDYILTLIEDNNVCIPLSEELIYTLFNQKLIYDENHPSSYTGKSISMYSNEASSIFGHSQHLLRHAVTNSRRRTGDVDLNSSRLREEDIDGAAFENMGGHQIFDHQPIMRYAKKLYKADVSRLGPQTHPQGHVTLVRGINNINPVNYFKDRFFEEGEWRILEASGSMETAIEEHARVTFEVYEEDTFLGYYRLLVVYKPKFDSGQNNRVMMLRWGEQLSSYLRKKVDHSGHYLVLEKYPEQQYVLRFVRHREDVGELM